MSCWRVLGTIKRQQRERERGEWLQQWVARRFLSSYASEIRHCARPSSQVIAGFQSFFVFFFFLSHSLFFLFLDTRLPVSLVSFLVSHFVFNLLLFIAVEISRPTSLKMRAQYTRTRRRQFFWHAAGICALHDDDFYMPKSLCNAQWIERQGRLPPPHIYTWQQHKNII